MFSDLLNHIKQEVVGIMSKVQVAREEDVEAIDQQRQAPLEMHFEHAEAHSAFEIEPDLVVEPEKNDRPFVRNAQKIGRNDPCPCGSGKKYKQCHGKLE